MDLVQAAILGIVQGATEFLPISSSGHLVLVPWLLGWPQPGLAFDAFLHLGTLVAVLVYFRRELIQLLVAWLASIRYTSIGDEPNRRLAWLIILGTLPAALLGIAFEGFFANFFSAPQAVSVFLLGTALILWLGEKMQPALDAAREKHQWGMAGLSLWDALLIGLAQAVAILPGISRSGATISAGLWRGLRREEAARFSFLLSAPVVLGAGMLKFWDLLQSAEFGNLGPILLSGFLAALISGYLAINFLLSFLQRRNLYPFALYCLLLGSITFLLSVLAR
ncbi:MAG: undecaprenyl-diphosphatase UppP [Chloroflexi bacterium]|nr:undecaprenyl-diphosphatase UppP [Chloroflexota bacterium]